MNRDEVIWAAGFFDGEGHVGFSTYRNRHGSGTPVIAVGQDKNPEVLHRFKDAVIVGVVYGPYKSNGRVTWAYKTNSWYDTQAVIAMLWQFLSTPKREQAVTVLKSFRPVVDALTHCINGHPYNEQNTYINRNGHRICRTCQRKRQIKTNAYKRERRRSSV